MLRKWYEIFKDGKLLFIALLFPDNVAWWTSKEKIKEGYTISLA